MPLFSSGVGREEERELIIVRVSMRARLEEKEEEEVVGLLEEGAKVLARPSLSFILFLLLTRVCCLPPYFGKARCNFRICCCSQGQKQRSFPLLPPLYSRNFIFLRERSVGYEIQ